MSVNYEYLELSLKYMKVYKDRILSNLNKNFVVTENTDMSFIVKTDYFELLIKIHNYGSLIYELAFTKIDHHESYDYMFDHERIVAFSAYGADYEELEEYMKDCFDEINEYYYSLVNDCFYVKNYERYIEIAYRNKNKYRYGDINVDDMFYSKVITWSKPWRFFKFLQPTLSYYDSYINESALLDAGFKKLKLY